MIPINPKSSRATLLAISGLFAVTLSVTSKANDNELQVSRYQITRLQATDEQIDLRSNVIEHALPRETHTVGQAIGHGKPVLVRIETTDTRIAPTSRGQKRRINLP